jgi:putative RecB family exonuclease
VELPLPSSLSPSRISSFKDCGLAFRYATIDRLPEPPTTPATLGSIVHRSLEHLFARPGPERTPAAAAADLATAWSEAEQDPELTDLALDDDELATMRARSEELVERYFQLEDPRPVRAVGLELKVEAQLGGARVRGIIDRLELDDDGALVVTDYKTGRPPSLIGERQRMLGVHVYSELVEQTFGVRPARVQLLYLAGPVAISAEPTDQSSRGMQRRVDAIWTAIERACERGEFRPRPGRLCDWCSFQAYCPAFEGDPEEAWRRSAANPSNVELTRPALARVG